MRLVTRLQRMLAQADGLQIATVSYMLSLAH